MGAINKQLPQRDFKKEFTDKITAIISTDALYKGTKKLTSFQEVCDLVLQRLASMKATTEFPIGLFIEISVGADHGIEHVSMFNMSKYLNLLAACTPDELSMSVNEFIIVHADILTLIANYNLVVQPISEAVQAEADKYNPKIKK
jgi:hypothetical protein